MSWLGKKFRLMRAWLITQMVIWLRSMQVDVFIRDSLGESFTKVKGYWLNEDVLCDWVGMKFPGENVLLLTNIDLSSRGRDYWASMPKDISKQFLQDVVVFKCKDLDEAMSLLMRMDSSFADAAVFSSGVCVGYN